MPGAEVVVGGVRFGGDRAPAVVGVLNLSPESPNRDTVAVGAAAARARAVRLAREGAAIIDVGARSSNFSAPDPGPREELRRMVPAVEALKAAGLLVSVDSWEADVLAAAAAAGADLLNCAEGLQDREVIAVVACTGLPVVVPFVNGPDPRRLAPIDLADPVGAMLPWLKAALERARRAGIDDVVLDPGTGFARRDLDHDAHDRFQRRVHADLHRLRALGRPLFAALPRRPAPQDTAALARELVEARVEFIRAHDPELVVEAIAALG